MERAALLYPKISKPKEGCPENDHGISPFFYGGMS